MKKAIVILLISLLVINNLGIIAPYGATLKDNHDMELRYNFHGELIDSCDSFYRINFKTSKDIDLKYTLNLLQAVIVGNKLSFEILEDNVFKDIKKNNFCNIYTSDTNGYNNVIIDMKLFVEDKSRVINGKEEKQKIDKLSYDIKDSLKNKIIKLDIKKNLRLKVNNKFSMLNIKGLVEEYLKRNKYKAKLVEIYNGYSINIEKNRDHDLGFQLSIVKYDNENYILFGDPDIYISY